MPTGGVAPTKENLSSWFDAGALCVGMGSKLLSKDLIASANYKQIETDVAKALDLVKEVRAKA